MDVSLLVHHLPKWELIVGPHYNPHNATHGGPTSSIRHVGDLGNVNNGVALFPGVGNQIGGAAPGARNIISLTAE